MSNGQVITNTGRKIAVHRVFDTSPAYTAPAWFKVGTGTTTPVVTDTVLGTPITIGGNPTKAISSVGYDDTNMVVTTRCLLLTTECNSNTLTEFGLVNNDGTPLLFSHTVHTGITKTTSVQVIYKEVDRVV
jgi:hypothetical protein